MDEGKGPTLEAPEAVAVSFREATKQYPGADRAAVDKLTLEVEAGEICVLVGPSGCGKTTAMRMANRMVEITEGDVAIGDRSVRDRSPAELRREIGYVIQQIGLFPHRTISQNIATVPACSAGTPSAPAPARRSCSGWSGSTRSSATATPPSSPGASSSGSASPGRWRPTPG